MKVSKTIRVNYETPFISLVERDFQHNGVSSIWAYATRRKVSGGKLTSDSRAVIIIAKTEDGDFVLNREFRVPLAGKSGTEGYNISFPAGMIDKGESPEQAAIRELSEETPYKVKKVLKVSPPLASSPGITDEMVYIVDCIVEPDPEGHSREAMEDIQTFLAKDICDPRIPKDTKWGVKCWLELERASRKRD